MHGFGFSIHASSINWHQACILKRKAQGILLVTFPVRWINLSSHGFVLIGNYFWPYSRKWNYWKHSFEVFPVETGWGGYPVEVLHIVNIFKKTCRFQVTCTHHTHVSGSVSPLLMQTLSLSPLLSPSLTWVHLQHSRDNSVCSSHENQTYGSILPQSRHPPLMASACR